MDQSIISDIKKIKKYNVFGKVVAIKGSSIYCSGLSKFVKIGSKCQIYAINGNNIYAEVIAIETKQIVLMSFSNNDDINIGCEVSIVESEKEIYPDNSWVGRVINAFCEAIDGKGKLSKGNKKYSLNNTPPPSYYRGLVDTKLDMGIKAVNCFLTCSYGQRMGIFAGSGVGKSVLLSMIACYAKADVKIIGLIGERGREVQEFLQRYLGSEGLKNSIVVVSTSDESALMRKRAAYLVFTIAEYFRDLGLNVICMVDSMTRFAFAQREIGLAIGEIPTVKGYTPSVFTELPKLLERAGNGINGGSITGIFSVLVDGDDTDEPIADNIRAILDGHIVLDRSIAEKGRYPAINILRSVSRTMDSVTTPQEYEIIKKARKIISSYLEMEDLIKLGLYKSGMNDEIDLAIKYYPKIEQFLSQMPGEHYSLEESYQQLKLILDM